MENLHSHFTVCATVCFHQISIKKHFIVTTSHYLPVSTPNWTTSIWSVNTLGLHHKERSDQPIISVQKTGESENGQMVLK